MGTRSDAMLNFTKNIANDKPLERLIKWLTKFVGFAVILLLWFMASYFKWMNASILPGPGLVLKTMVHMVADGSLLMNTLASLQRVFIGFCIALLIAVPLGLLLGTSNRIRHVVEPVIEIFRPIPPIAIIPLSILWFGIGELSKVFIIAYAAFFPILLNVMGGVQNVETIHIKAAQTLGVNRLQMFVHVTIRSAIPYIVLGMRSGISMAFISLVAAELIASNSGLGFLIEEGRALFKTDEVIVGMITIGIIGFLINRVLLELENKVVKWK